MLTFLKNKIITNIRYFHEKQENTIRKEVIKQQKNKKKKKGTKKKPTNKHRINWKIRFKMAINTDLLIITLCQWLKCCNQKT